MQVTFVLEALSILFREDLPMKLLYGYALVFITETMELWLVLVRKMEKGMEKGLQVNAGGTNIMCCKVSMVHAQDSGEHL